MIPHVHPPHWHKQASEARFASKIRTSPEGCAAGLLGFADDDGVRLNNGRVGARGGPQAFRDALARYGSGHPEGFDWPLVFDAGDVSPGLNMTESHRNAFEASQAVQRLGLLPVGIGGGHDMTLPLARAAATAHGPLTMIYFDAHLDVRDTPGSGMAFRKLIEEGAVTELHVLGLSPFANSREHVAYFREHRGFAHELDAFDPALWRDASNLAVSVDLDVLDAAHAPGVSAVNPCGVTPAQVSAAVRTLGRDPRVRCFDIMELNPLHDHEGRTAKVAAHLFLSFLRGFAERSA